MADAALAAPFIGNQALARMPGGTANAPHRVMLVASCLRGIQRRSTAASAQRSRVSGETWRKALLACGVVSSLLYASMIWGIRYEGYSPVSQVPSELTAIGAPTQALWTRLGWIYTVLITAFGIGVWRSAGGDRAVRLVGGLVLGYAEPSTFFRAFRRWTGTTPRRFRSKEA
jgi:hypothetical protein